MICQCQKMYENVPREEGRAYRRAYWMRYILQVLVGACRCSRVGAALQGKL